MEKAIHKAKEKVADEISALSKKEVLTPEEVKCLGEFIDMAKDISTIEGMDTYTDYLMEDEQPSMASYGNRSMRNMPRVNYRYENTSTRRGRSPTTGRFVSRDGSPEGNSYERGYSEGYSDAMYDRRSEDMGRSGHSIKDRMVDSLEQMYDRTSSDHERQVVDKWIKKINAEEM